MLQAIRIRIRIGRVERGTRFCISRSLSSRTRPKHLFVSARHVAPVVATTLLGTALCLGLWPSSDYTTHCEQERRNPAAPTRKFTKAQVSKYTTKETGIYVTFKEGVYDITNFIEYHPGGAVILQAAGGGVDKFWALYKQHLRSEVLDILEEYRVGTLEDYDPHQVELVENHEYVHEPTDRLRALPVYSKYPFNAGTVESLVTENVSCEKSS